MKEYAHLRDDPEPDPSCHKKKISSVLQKSSISNPHMKEENHAQHKLDNQTFCGDDDGWQHSN